MTALKQRNDVGRLFLRRVGLLCLGLLVVAGSWGVWNAWRKDRESLELRTQSEAAAADFSTQESQLKENIAHLESDRGKEEVLRDQYAVGKQGEKLIVIVDSAQPLPPLPAPTIMDRLKGVFKWW